MSVSVETMFFRKTDNLYRSHILFSPSDYFLTWFETKTLGVEDNRIVYSGQRLKLHIYVYIYMYPEGPVFKWSSSSSLFGGCGSSFGDFGHVNTITTVVLMASFNLLK